jgi:hypothetical protein
LIWLPVLAFAYAMALVAPVGSLSGQVGGRDARIEWRHHAVFVLLAHCDAGEACQGVAYQSSRPFSFTPVAYGGAAPSAQSAAEIAGGR